MPANLTFRDGDNPPRGHNAGPLQPAPDPAHLRAVDFDHLGKLYIGDAPAFEPYS